MSRPLAGRVVRGRVVIRPSGHKYSAVRCTLDGHTFPSKHEAERYAQLQLLAKAGRIRELQLQPSFRLVAAVTAFADVVAGLEAAVTASKVVATYRADFMYQERDRDRWRVVVEDAKGVRTPLYRLKKRWFEAQYGVSIREV